MKYARILALTAGSLASFCLFATAEDDEYRLKPRDTIGISVWNEPNLAISGIAIDPSGYLRFPLVGRFKAAGKTLTELEDELAEAYSEYVKDPIIFLALVDFDLLRVSVLGRGVNRPGVFRMKEGATVAEAIASAGATTGFADLKNAFLTRAGSDVTIPIDVELLLKGDMSQNLTLQDGDLLVLDEDLLNRYFVLGYVMRPGVFPLRDEARTVLDAISSADGEQPRGDLRRVNLIRGYPDHPVLIPLDLDQILQTGALPDEIYLQAGDIVYVREKPGMDWNELSREMSTLSSTAYLLRLFDVINP